MSPARLEAHGVEKVVQLSALGADPDGSTAYIRAKGAAGEIIRDSPLDWVIVRPSVVFGECGEFVSFTKTLTAPYLTGLPGGGSTRFQPMGSAISYRYSRIASNGTTTSAKRTNSVGLKCSRSPT